MKILALDTSISNTGWAYYQEGEGSGSVQTGAKSFKLGTPAQVKKMNLTEEQIKGEQAIRFQKWIREMIVLYKPDEIAVEKSFLNLNPSTEILVGIQIILLQTARHFEIPVFRYATSSLKALALEPGYVGRYKHLSQSQRSKAVKNEMVEAVYKLTGDSTPISHDEADAFWVLQLHLKNRG